MKRGESGLSLLVAIDKPLGMSSHDVVNACRRVFGERRVGHTGTLDPMATGVLPVCVGPATRLDQYMTGHDKRYRVTVAFGCETTTDDAEGEPTVRGALRPELLDEEFCRRYVAGLVGGHEQVPPQYSAVKVQGKRAYQLARSGDGAQLEPRHVEVYEATFVSCHLDGRCGYACWVVDVAVSKGTYIRALARDMGRDLGCPAHVAALQRRQSGCLTIDDCVSLQSLEALGVDAALDPVAVLGYRFAFADDVARPVLSGAKLPADALALFEPPVLSDAARMCACTGSLVKSPRPPADGEVLSVVVENRLKALYSYDAGNGTWKPSCVFSIGVIRR